jgi:hypothetical protein
MGNFDIVFLVRGFLVQAKHKFQNSWPSLLSIESFLNVGHNGKTLPMNVKFENKKGCHEREWN